MKLKFAKTTWHKIRRIYINGKYKDRLFCMAFHDKRELLILYNAINGTNYTNPDDLIITTIGDVIYLGMKNDVSFLIGSDMNLYEHQSTWNPNMPLRGLMYFADLIRGYIEQHELDIYSSGRIMIPTPKYYVLYNGTKEEPDKSELVLSDSFLGGNEEPPFLECRAVVLNINKGHNKELMAKSKRLSDYAYFVQAVRDNLDRGMPFEQAVDSAVDECIRKDILGDILRKHRGEVKDVLLTTYNRKLHNRTLRREGREEGREEGKEEGKAEVIHAIRRQLNNGLSTEEIAKWMDLSLDYVNQIGELSKEYPQETDIEIARRWLKAEKSD